MKFSVNLKKSSSKTSGAVGGSSVNSNFKISLKSKDGPQRRNEPTNNSVKDKSGFTATGGRAVFDNREAKHDDEDDDGTITQPLETVTNEDFQKDAMPAVRPIACKNRLPVPARTSTGDHGGDAEPVSIANGLNFVIGGQKVELESYGPTGTAVVQGAGAVVQGGGAVVQGAGAVVQDGALGMAADKAPGRDGAGSAQRRSDGAAAGGGGEGEESISELKDKLGLKRNENFKNVLNKYHNASITTNSSRSIAHGHHQQQQQQEPCTNGVSGTSSSGVWQQGPMLLRRRCRFETLQDELASLPDVDPYDHDLVDVDNFGLAMLIGMGYNPNKDNNTTTTSSSRRKEDSRKPQMVEWRSAGLGSRREMEKNKTEFNERKAVARSSHKIKLPPPTPKQQQQQEGHVNSTSSTMRSHTDDGAR